MKRLLLSPWMAMLVAIALAGCGQSADKAGTTKTSIEINLPDLPEDATTLADTLKQVADHAKREFNASLPDVKEFPEYADRKFEMQLDFEVTAQSARFISVKETGFEDTGGAHPIPVSSTFVYDRKQEEVIPLSRLFKDDQRALEALSAYARKALLASLQESMPEGDDITAEMKADWQTVTQQMMEEGTTPSAENFANFLVQGEGDAESPGITLVFPPYQVAAYAYGTQTVDVPAKVFADYLDASYRDAFVTP